MGDVDESPDAPDTREVHIVKGSDPNHPLGDASVVFGESKPDMYVYVRAIDTNGTAAQCGLRIGDVIDRINGESVALMGTDEVLSALYEASSPIQVNVFHLSDAFQSADPDNDDGLFEEAKPWHRPNNRTNADNESDGYSTDDWRGDDADTESHADGRDLNIIDAHASQPSHESPSTRDHDHASTDGGIIPPAAAPPVAVLGVHDPMTKLEASLEADVLRRISVSKFLSNHRDAMILQRVADRWGGELPPQHPPRRAGDDDGEEAHGIEPLEDSVATVRKRAPPSHRPSVVVEDDEYLVVTGRQDDCSAGDASGDNGDGVNNDSQHRYPVGGVTRRARHELSHTIAGIGADVASDGGDAVAFEAHVLDKVAKRWAELTASEEAHEGAHDEATVLHGVASTWRGRLSGTDASDGSQVDKRDRSEDAERAEREKLEREEEKSVFITKERMLETQIDELRATVRALEEEIDGCSKSMRGMEAAMSLARAERDAAVQARDEALGDLALAHKEAETQWALLDEADAHIVSSEQDLRAASAKQSALAVEKNALEEELLREREDRSRLESRVGGLQAERDAVMTRNADLSAQLDAFHAEVAAVRLARVAETAELVTARARVLDLESRLADSSASAARVSKTRAEQRRSGAVSTSSTGKDRGSMSAIGTLDGTSRVSDSKIDGLFRSIAEVDADIETSIEDTKAWLQQRREQRVAERAEHTVIPSTPNGR